MTACKLHSEWRTSCCQCTEMSKAQPQTSSAFTSEGSSVIWLSRASSQPGNRVVQHQLTAATGCAQVLNAAPAGTAKERWRKGQKRKEPHVDRAVSPGPYLEIKLSSTCDLSLSANHDWQRGHACHTAVLQCLKIQRNWEPSTRTGIHLPTFSRQKDLMEDSQPLDKASAHCYPSQDVFQLARDKTGVHNFRILPAI